MAEQHIEQLPAEHVEEQPAVAEAPGVEPVVNGHDAPAVVPTAEMDDSAAGEAIKAAAAKAAALAAQFAQAHESHGDDAASNKRKPEDFRDDEPLPKRMNEVPHISFGAGGEVTETIQVPSSKVGKLIGKSGVTIKEIQARGMTRVKIEHEALGDTKPVTISGTPDNVAMTKRLIDEALTSDPAAGGGHMGSQGEAHRKISCPAHIVGRIIGRGGETIRTLQAASSAHIVINQDFPQGQPREVEISGNPESVARAYQMVMELIGSEGAASTQTVIQKFGGGITRVVDCPKHMVGRIIGKGGETIKGLQKQFAASIQIDQNVAPCKITIAGPAHAVSSVERAVMELIEDRPAGGGGGFGGGGGGPPFGGAPNFPPYGGGGGGFAPPPFAGYAPPPFPAYGAPPAYGGYPAYNQPPPAPAPAYGGYGGYGAAPADPYAAGGYGGGAPQGAGGYAQQPQQPAPQPVAAPAPSVWQEMKDDQQRSYYYNSQTGVSQWERPADM